MTTPWPSTSFSAVAASLQEDVEPIFTSAKGFSSLIFSIEHKQLLLMVPVSAKSCSPAPRVDLPVVGNRRREAGQDKVLYQFNVRGVRAEEEDSGGLDAALRVGAP